MEDDLDPTVIKSTQLSLGKYVKRPPLTDKLLRKPPFRFLHDIVTSVLKNTGFFRGLFEENELISENVKDRESKISFLNKVITVVSLTTGKQLTVKPSKIVAGQEPAKTNELLQCLAQALENNISSDEAVKNFKSGVKISLSNDKKNKDSVKVLKKNIEPKKLTSRSSEKLVTNEKDGQSQNMSKNKDILVNKKESPPKKSLSKISNKKPAEKSKQEVKKNIMASELNQVNKPKTSGSQKPADADNYPKHNQEELILNEETVSSDKESSLNEKILQPDINVKNNLTNVETDGPEEQPVVNPNESSLKPTSSDKSVRTNDEPNQFEIRKEENVASYSLISNKSESELGPEESNYELVNQLKNEEIKNQSSHQSDTAVSEAFQVKPDEPSHFQTSNSFDKKELNSSNIIRPSSVRPSSSRPGAPRIRDKSDNVMNSSENMLVGKVNIISENTLQEEEEDTSVVIKSNTTEELHEILQNQEHNNLASNQNSHLVQQILDSQKEFSQISGKTEIEWQFGAQKAPDIFIQEMEQLKFNVQAMSRIANPLGKLLDHIQEDVEVMRQELQQWTQLYEESSKDLSTQINATNEALLPFHAKLKQLTADMEERHEKITDLKISIYKNNSRIEKLLTNSNVQ